MSTTSPPRRTNAERTAATRTKILDAAVACLDELGYGHTTTTIVARRAGVSRGALLHNFPTRSDLVVAAAEHVFDQRVQEVRALARRVDEQDRSDAVIGLILSMTRSATCDAIFEVVSAGRTDPDLRPLVASLSERFQRAITGVFTDLFPRPADPALAPFYDAIPILFMAIADGIAVQRIAGGAVADHHDAVLELTKYLGRVLSEQAYGAPDQETPA